MVKRLQKKERVTTRLIPVLKFLVIFNLLAIPLYVALYTNFSFEPLQEFNAKIVASTLKIFGYNADVKGFTINLVTGDITQKIDISWDSTGWKSMYALASLIIATPISKISKRIKFAVLGIGVIFLINYLRILTTIIISAIFGFSLFNIIHTVLWREGLILAVIGLWFTWMVMEKYKIWKIK